MYAWFVSHQLDNRILTASLILLLCLCNTSHNIEHVIGIQKTVNKHAIKMNSVNEEQYYNKLLKISEEANVRLSSQYQEITSVNISS